MRQPLPRLIVLALAGVLAASPLARADESVFQMDTRFRAKLAKEKVKRAAFERESRERADASDDSRGASSGSECGSQSIGAIDLGDRKPGALAPREIFVFAPNATNIVTGRGCR